MWIAFVVYLICAAVCGVLHWAKYRDDVENECNYRDLQEKVIFLYLIPLTPVLNGIAIIIALANYAGL